MSEEQAPYNANGFQQAFVRLSDLAAEVDSSLLAPLEVRQLEEKLAEAREAARQACDEVVELNDQIFDLQQLLSEARQWARTWKESAKWWRVAAKDYATKWFESEGLEQRAAACPMVRCSVCKEFVDYSDATHHFEDDTEVWICSSCEADSRPEEIMFDEEFDHECPCGCENDPYQCVYTGSKFSIYEICPSCRKIKYQNRMCQNCEKSAQQANGADAER